MKAESQFTYIDQAIKILRQPWIRPVDTVLAKFQDGINRLHQETLRSTDANYKDLAEQALTWTLLKQDDLHISEFFDIFSRRYTADGTGADIVDSGAEAHELAKPAPQPDKTSDEDSKMEEDTEHVPDHESSGDLLQLYKDQIHKAAATFIGVSTGNTLAEGHQSVPDCFLKEEDDPTRVPGFFYISREQGHLRITLELLKALNSEAFGKVTRPTRTCMSMGQS